MPDGHLGILDHTGVWSLGFGCDTRSLCVLVMWALYVDTRTSRTI